MTRLVSNNLDLYSKFINLNFDQSKNFTSLLGLDWCNKNDKLTFKGLKMDIDGKTVYAKEIVAQFNLKNFLPLRNYWTLCFVWKNNISRNLVSRLGLG